MKNIKRFFTLIMFVLNVILIVITFNLLWVEALRTFAIGLLIFLVVNAYLGFDYFCLLGRQNPHE